MTPKTLVAILRERVPYLVLSSVVLALDRWSKSFIQEAFSPGEQRPIIGAFFDLVYFQNEGIAFGLFDGSDNPRIRLVLLSAIAAVAAIIVVIYSLRSPVANRLLQTGLALILGGAVGNLYDRIAVGYVTDFLYFHLGSFYWPAFNVADTALSIGVVLMVIETFRHELRDRA